MPTPDQPTDLSPPLRSEVGDCPHCDKLFALPLAAEPFDAVGCPACGEQISLSTIATRPLPVAEAISSPVPVSPPTRLLSEVPEQDAKTALPADPGHESLDDWLRRTTGLSEPTVAEKEKTESHEVVPATPKKNPLRETLGWAPETLAPAAAEQVLPSLDLPQEDPSSVLDKLPKPALSDFGFDLDKSLLEEEPPITEEVPIAEKAEAVAASTHVPELETPSMGVSWETAHEPQFSQGWMGPLSAVAGLLVVGGATYYFMAPPFGGTPSTLADAGANRAVRAELTQPHTPAVQPVEFPPKGANPAVAVQAKEAPVTSQGVAVASFESTAEPVKTTVGDRYAMPDPHAEPNPFEQADSLPMAAAPLAPPVGLLGAPSYTYDELTQALAESEEAGEAFAQGTLADTAQVPAMGQHYARLCYLAQVLTLLDRDDPHPENKTTEMLAMDVYKRMFRAEGPRLDASQVAGPWVSWADRPHGGVFFTGIPNDFHRAGDLFEYQFLLGGEPLFVVTEEKIDVKRFILKDAREMGVLGVVVENPRERIAGYEGDAERVVWCRKTIPLAPVLTRP